MNKQETNKLLKDFDNELDEIVDFLFDAAVDLCDYSWYDIAQNSGLSYTTVQRLGDRITRQPRFSTIWKIARCVGYSFSYSSGKFELKAA